MNCHLLQYYGSSYNCLTSPSGATRWQHQITNGPITLQWRHNEHNGVWNHQPHDCLLNRFFRRRSKKTLKLRVTDLGAGFHQWPANSPHKGPVTWKMFPFDGVIMYAIGYFSGDGKVMVYMHIKLISNRDNSKCVDARSPVKYAAFHCKMLSRILRLFFYNIIHHHSTNLSLYHLITYSHSLSNVPPPSLPPSFSLSICTYVYNYTKHF